MTHPLIEEILEDLVDTEICIQRENGPFIPITLEELEQMTERPQQQED